MPYEVAVLGVRQLVHVQGTPGQRAPAIGGYQRARLARRQLLAVAVSDRMIDGMLGTGCLLPRLPGVYAVGHDASVELARLRFTARRIRDEPSAVIAEIALMLGRRTATLASAA